MKKAFFLTLFTAVLALSSAFSAYAEPDPTKPAEDVTTASEPNPLGTADPTATTDASAASGTSTIDPSRPVIAITFDDGPHSSNTARLLSILEQCGAKATFFVVGSNVGGKEALLQRMIADGCEIGNHSWGHENLAKTSHDKTIQTLNATSDAIQAACGVRPVITRPPYGSVDNTTLATIGSLGMSAILWNVDTLDWKTKNAQSTIDHVLSHASDGNIILMHDIHSATIDACATLIPELVNRGYQLVTISELAAYRGGLTPGAKYYSFK